jgi:hypothetical protein
MKEERAKEENDQEQAEKEHEQEERGELMERLQQAASMGRRLLAENARLESELLTERMHVRDAAAEHTEVIELRAALRVARDETHGALVECRRLYESNAQLETEAHAHAARVRELTPYRQNALASAHALEEYKAEQQRRELTQRKENQRLRSQMSEMVHDLEAEKREWRDQVALLAQQQNARSSGLMGEEGGTENSGAGARQREELKALRSEVVQLRRAMADQENLHLVVDSLVRANRRSYSLHVHR